MCSGKGGPGGSRLIGAAVVGPGLPQVGARQEQLRDYFERTRGSGFDYAYRYPGMNKVLQAAGRVIRTSQDRGVVLLIDDRFSMWDYRRLMPPHWSHFTPVYDCNVLRTELEKFWQTDNPDAGPGRNREAFTAVNRKPISCFSCADAETSGRNV